MYLAAGMLFPSVPRFFRWATPSCVSTTSDLLCSTTTMLSEY